MKNFIKKIKNWLKSEKVVSRATLILLCLSIFGCGVLYTLIITNDSCSNESSSIITLTNNETNVESEIIAEDNLALPSSESEYKEIEQTINFSNLVSNDIDLNLPVVDKPNFTEEDIQSIYDYIYNYANNGVSGGIGEDFNVDYNVTQRPYLSYAPYNNLLYIPASAYDMNMYLGSFSNTPSGLQLSIDSYGFVHINGYSSVSSYLRLDITNLLKYSFLDLSKSYVIYPSNPINFLPADFYVGVYKSGTNANILSSKMFSSSKNVIVNSCKPLNSVKLELQILVGAGNYNDFKFGICLDANSNFTENWQGVQFGNFNYAFGTQAVFDIYRNALYGFNKCFSKFDIYVEEYGDFVKDKVNDIYNNRDFIVNSLSSIVSAPINFLKDTLNFSLFGFNLFNILASILTLLLSAFVIKKLL